MSSQPKGAVEPQVTRVAFSHMINQTLVSGAVTLTCNPATFGRVNSVADTFELYRIAALKYRIHPYVVASATTFQKAVAFYPGITDTAPTSCEEVAQNIYRCIMGGGQVTPTQWAHVSKTALRGMFPWYKTIPGSLDPSEENVGYFFLRGTGSEVVCIEFEGVFEFKGPVSTGSTPALRVQQAVARERQRLLQILSQSPQREAPTAGKP